MNQLVNFTTGQISISKDTPRFIFDDISYLDFGTISSLFNEEIPKTTLFYRLKSLLECHGHSNAIRYKNRSYYKENFVLIYSKELIKEC